MAKSISLSTKKAYARKSRARNYAASMRLEGIEVDQVNSDSSAKTKAQIINKYKLSASR